MKHSIINEMKFLAYSDVRSLRIIEKLSNVRAICRNSTCAFEYSELEDYLPFGRPRAERIRYTVVVSLEGPVVIPPLL